MSYHHLTTFMRERIQELLAVDIFIGRSAKG